MVVADGNFTVTTTAKQAVGAAVPTQDHHGLPFSNLDWILPAVDCGVFFCYKNDDHKNSNEKSFNAKVGVLKKALAQALAYFYPFAGEVGENESEAEFRCNNRGVEFVEAVADVELSELNLYNPDQSIEGKFVPTKKEGLLAVQVTGLKCGGMVVACSFDHRVADAYSTNMFLVMWAEMANSKPISVHPCFRRSLLCPRHPLKYDSTLDDEYITISPLMLSTTDQDDDHHKSQNLDPIISRIYYISAEQLCHLQFLASNSNTDTNTTTNGYCKRTKLQSFSAFLWKMIASHVCQTAPENASKNCKMGIVVDGRIRLSHEESQDRGASLASYFGNVLAVPFGKQKGGDLDENPLSWVGEQVQNFLEPAVKKEHFLGLIDWVEEHKPKPILSKIYWAGNDDGPAFVVSSGLRFPISEVDFGWGKPAFGSYHFPWGGNCGYIMPMPSPTMNGDWVVYMHLLQSQIHFIEANAPNIFQPFSLDLISSK